MRQTPYFMSLTSLTYEPLRVIFSQGSKQGARIRYTESWCKIQKRILTRLSQLASSNFKYSDESVIIQRLLHILNGMSQCVQRRRQLE